jgi:lysozyme family protein
MTSTRTEAKVFELALNFTLEWEAGQANHVDDLGGRTNRGITQATYDQWRDSQNKPRGDVFSLTQFEAIRIYQSRYWQLGPLSEKLHDALEVVHFDTCVMHGVVGGTIFLQELFDLVQDGIYGPKTAAALLANNNLAAARKYCDNRMAYRFCRVDEDKSQRSFLQGWLARDRALKGYVQEVGLCS